MVAITGFVMATMTSSLLDIFTPEASQESIWLYFACFGGFLQIYAGVKDFHHGNTLTACIFFLFGFHWVSKGFLMGNLLFLQNVENPDHVPNDAIMGVYYMVFMMFTALLTFCTYLSPHGSWLLVVILGIVVVKLALASIDSWTPHRELVITGGVLGVAVCLLAVYSFIADSLAEHGVVIATGKFGGTKTRPQVKKENAGHDE
jgi:succinate-acetate transporter protein